MADDERDFYQSLPILGDFAAAVRAENYRPLPDDWSVGLSDIVGSTKAIAEGRYKAVNMIGAGVIAAVSNALGGRPFPVRLRRRWREFRRSARSTRPRRPRRSRPWRPSRTQNSAWISGSR